MQNNVKMWQEIIIDYNKNSDESLKLTIKELLEHPQAESIFLYYSIWCGFPVLVELLWSASALQDSLNLKRLCNIPKRYLYDKENSFIKPLELAAQCGQYHMFVCLEKRDDVDYSKCFYWAKKMKNTELISYMIKNNLI